MEFLDVGFRDIIFFMGAGEDLTETVYSHLGCSVVYGYWTLEEKLAVQPPSPLGSQSCVWRGRECPQRQITRGAILGAGLTSRVGAQI